MNTKDIVNLQSQLKNIRYKVQEEGTGFSAYYFIPPSILSDIEKDALFRYMPFIVEDDELRLYILNNISNRIIFENFKSAKLTAEMHKDNLLKQFLFSMYRKDKIKILPYQESSDSIPIKFVEI